MPYLFPLSPLNITFPLKKVGKLLDSCNRKVLFSFQNEASEVGDETLILTDETVVHEKTLEIHDNEKTIEAHENELNEEKVEKVTSVDEPEVQVDEAPLASMESDPAPLASLDSATSSELQSM